jgi:nitrogen fixation negative regulator NifL
VCADKGAAAGIPGADASVEDAYRVFFDNHPHPMWIFDTASFAFLAVNDAAVHEYGYSRAEFLGMTIMDIRPQEDVSALVTRLAERHTGPRAAGVWRHQKRDGTVCDVSVTVHAFRFAGRDARLVMATDVTEQRRLEREQRLALAALQAAANGIVITDREGTITWVNDAFTSTTGYETHEVLGRTPSILKSGEHDARFYGQLWRTIRAGEVWRGDIVNRRKDGRRYIEEMTITPVRVAGGDITHFVAIKHDVTEGRRVAEALRHSEGHYRSLIENALDMILLVDRDGTVRYASPSVERLLGYRPDDLVGTQAFDLLHPDDVAQIVDLFSRSADRPGAIVGAEYRLRHRDGSWRIIEAIGRNLLDDPAVHGAVINGRDITERRRAEEEQRFLRGKLAQSEKLAAMAELLAGIAHNPLSVVIGQAELLQKRGADDGVTARADRIARAANRCARIVKNFLALARRYPPERRTIDVNALVRDAVELIAYALRVDNVDVELDLVAELPALSADAHQLQQLLINLLTNAHHAVRERPDGRQLRVATTFDPLTSQVIIAVADNGHGVPPDIEARMFEPFFTTKSVGQGTGLGLSLCKGIVESHGGTIAVDGRPGLGAHFRVSLPLGTAPAATDPEPMKVTPSCRLLVVDDEADVAAALAETLSERGHRVTVAASAREALELIAADRWDLIVTDVKMPELDGPGLYRELQRRRPELLPRLVFMTGDALSPTTARFLNDVAGPHLEKPFTAEDVELLLRRVLDDARGTRGAPPRTAAP